ncbi:MAG: potassium channel family protein [Pontibacterium sp.]
MKQTAFYTIDDYGVRNYRKRMLALVSVGGLYLIIALLSFLLLAFEAGAEGANINNYTDAFWTLQMSASTIGFGDHYPITIYGRAIVALMFYIGVGLVGFIGALIADRVLGFADTNVKNRELRKQNADILKHNQLLEAKIDLLVERVEAALKK